MEISNSSAYGIIGGASNVSTGSNPPFLLADFIVQYPQFGPNTSGAYIIPVIIIQMYIDLADSCIKEVKWHSNWKIAMGWFIAHFCTMYLQGMADPNSGAAAVLAAGQARGLDTSQSVDGVSVSTDYNTISEDLAGWASWKSTIYGQQLASIGKLIGMAGSYVY